MRLHTMPTRGALPWAKHDDVHSSGFTITRDTSSDIFATCSRIWLLGALLLATSSPHYVTFLPSSNNSPHTTVRPMLSQYHWLHFKKNRWVTVNLDTDLHHEKGDLVRPLQISHEWYTNDSKGADSSCTIHRQFWFRLTNLGLTHMADVPLSQPSFQ